MNSKYRGRRLDNGERVEGFYVKCVDPEQHWIITEGLADVDIHYGLSLDHKGQYGCYLVDPDTVGQWTGKKDKKLREVYVDDVYECENGPMVVKYDSRICQYLLESMINPQLVYPLIILDSIDYPYSGSIHDTPERREGKE